jgi:hypothetical protein
MSLSVLLAAAALLSFFTVLVAARITSPAPGTSTWTVAVPFFFGVDLLSGAPAYASRPV